MKKSNPFIKYVFIISAILMSLIFVGCGEKDYGTEFTTEPLTDAGYQMENVVVEVPGLTGEYNILLVADMHIICNNDEVAESKVDDVKGRIKQFSPDGGKTTALKLWKDMPGLLDKCNADIILFAGDMVDFCSEANVDALKEGLDKLETPYCYVKSDHDVLPFYMANTDDDICAERQSDIGVNSKAWYVDLGEIVILCYNRSDKSMSEDGLEVVKEAVALDKPIILLSHVPFNSDLDTSLAEKSCEVFGGKNLTWGVVFDSTGYTTADPAGLEFLSIVYAEDSPVKEILAGHLHFMWDGPVTDSVNQHVFTPTFTKRVGYITVKGTN